MSSPRPSSRPKALLPSALPHDHEGASPSSPRRARTAATAAGAAPAPAPASAASTTPATTASSKTQAPARPSSSSTTNTVQSKAMQSGTAPVANYSHTALSGGGDEQYSSAPILIEESSPYPQFQPFFTLVDDGTDPGHPSIHPSVSYIFADDDQEPITGAAIRIDSSSSHRPKAPKRPPDAVAAGSGVGGSASRRRSVQGGVEGGGTANPAAASAPEVIERCVLITLGPDGRSIESAVSLTPDWHVDGAELSAAPTLDGEGGLAGTSPGAAVASVAARISEEDSATGASAGAGDAAQPVLPDGPLMLRIRGSEVPTAIGQNEALGMGLDGLCQTFKERLAELKKVVDAAAVAEEDERVDEE